MTKPEPLNDRRAPRKRRVTRTEIPGPRSKAMAALEREHMAPGLQSFAQLSGIVVESAQGSTVRDVDGNVLLDIIGGIGVNSLGHSHPSWVAAIQAQAALISIGSFTSGPRIDLLTRIAAHRPGPDMHRTQLYSSGAEAVESALRLAKCATQKWEIVSFHGGFHGKTLGALSLMGSEAKQGYGPLAPGSHVVPYADCYRCPLALTYPSCGLACVDAARKQLKSESQGAIAAFIVEPMQGTAGNIRPPDDWMRAIASLAREFDALLIADEMITGFGRTGTYWGIEHSGIAPDIVTLGKQFGGGFPISGVMAREGVIDAKPWANPSGSSSSYGGNPLAAAAAAATLKVIDDENLVENSRKVGAHFRKGLQAFERYPFVGKIDGSGLLIGIELVEDKASRVPLSSEKTKGLFKDLLRRGLLTMAYSPSFRIQPAMTIDEEAVDQVLEILHAAFREFEKF
jgi:4-aminobutyrate aminotransferase/(S)-3-amino-2-methylpropionate transaminase